MSKAYLGDAVYVDIDSEGRIVLTTENGICATNTIILEPEVLLAFMEYIEKAIENEVHRANMSTDGKEDGGESRGCCPDS